jgi:hypothetical protein
VVTTGLANFFGQNTTDWGAAIAFSTLAMLPPLVLFVRAQRPVMAGLLAGGGEGLGAGGPQLPPPSRTPTAVARRTR